MPFLEYIRNLDPKPDLTGVRLLSGATEPPIAMMKGFADLTGAEVIHAYGATETTPLVTINRIKPWMESTISEEDRWDRKRKQGYSVNGLDLKVVDLSDNPVQNDGKTAGELLIRGPWITGRYHEAPGSEVQFTPDGYWRSGDVATIDEEGYVKITDRVKDVIKSGGEWISSVDMENEIMSHPAVSRGSRGRCRTSQMAGATAGTRGVKTGGPGKGTCRRYTRTSGSEIRQMAIAG